MILNTLLFPSFDPCERVNTFKSPATVRTMCGSHANTILRITYFLQSCAYKLQHGVWFTPYYSLCCNTVET